MISAFLAVHGPMKTILASGLSVLIILDISAIGERLCETAGTRAGYFFSMYSTNAGQQEDISLPFSSSSADSLYAVTSAPRAASYTSLKPSFLIAVITLPVSIGENCDASEHWNQIFLHRIFLHHRTLSLIPLLTQ